MLSVPRCDFNWQRDYFPEEPIKVPAGSRLVCTAVFDNSPANRFNPDPTTSVAWGGQTWQEMMVGFINRCPYVVPTSPLVATAGAPGGAPE